MLKCTLLSLVITVVYCGPINAQGKGGLLKGLQGNNDSDNPRNDVEGFIWEYKLIEPDERDRSERTKMTGRLRIKQTSVFAVGQVKYTNDIDQGIKDAEQAGPGNGSLAGGGPGALRERLQDKTSTTRGEEGEDVKKQAKNLLSQRLKQESEEQTGSERIGDLIKQTQSEYKFRFDEDDEYPLSGLAVLKPDTKSKGGVWLGRYDEFENGKKKKTWRIEMRKIEE